MQTAATRKDAYELLHEGALVLSKISRNGNLIDVDYLSSIKEKIDEELKQEMEKFCDYPEIKYWKKTFGASFNVASRTQLVHILYDYLKYKCPKQTKTGNLSLDSNVLEQLEMQYQNPMLTTLIRIRKLQKAYTTYIAGIARETGDDGLLHTNYCLHLARSYRSSSQSPNLQNIPVRDENIKKYIRTMFIPRKGRQILEIDFKGAEVNVAFFYHKDPTMEAYLTDPTKDMHRDMAKELFILSDDEWNKKSRHAAKNKFVFPEFYGSYYKNVGTDLWNAIALNKLCTGKNNDKLSLYDHLARKSIQDMEQFINHVKKIEDDFWNRRFPVYTEWKEQWLRAYQKKGYFDSLTGFRYTGILKKNEVINYPIQGSAFHCLLWCLIQVQKWLEKNKMKTLIVGQIHDSIVLDICPEEKDDVLYQIQKIVRIDLKKHWSWILFPMTIEAEIAGIDEPWSMKKETNIEKYKPD